MLSPPYTATAASRRASYGNQAGIRLRPGASMDRFVSAAAALAKRYPASGGKIDIISLSNGVAATQRAMATAFAQSGVSGQMGLRKGKDGHVFVTDGGHWIIDAHLGRITDAPRLAGLLSLIPGVVEHGLFIGLATTAILAGAQGIRVVERR